MEVFRHSRRRSRYHSLSKEELLRKKRSNRPAHTKTSKKKQLYQAIDEQWRRHKDDEWLGQTEGFDQLDSNSNQKEEHEE
jgi:hypothetical protein